HLVGDAAERREVDHAGVGGRPTDQEARSLASGDLPYLVVLNAARVFANAVMHRPEQGAREVDRGAVRQVAAVRQRQPEQGVARLGDGEVGGHVRLRPRVRLHVDVLRLEQGPGAVDRELLAFVDHLAPAVVALPGQPFGVFVGEGRPHRFHHGDGDEVLARDELEAVLLAFHLAADELGDRRVGLGERGAPVDHESILATRRSWRPPSNAVSSHLCRISNPSSSLTNRAGNTSTLASLCLRASSAISGLQATAARTRGNRLATYAIPSPVPQVRTPRRAFPVLTASATGRPKSGKSSAGSIACGPTSTGS